MTAASGDGRPVVGLSPSGGTTVRRLGVPFRRRCGRRLTVDLHLDALSDAAATRRESSAGSNEDQASAATTTSNPPNAAASSGLDVDHFDEPGRGQRGQRRCTDHDVARCPPDLYHVEGARVCGLEGGGTAGAATGASGTHHRGRDGRRGVTDPAQAAPSDSSMRRRARPPPRPPSAASAASAAATTIATSATATADDGATATPGTSTASATASATAPAATAAGTTATPGGNPGWRPRRRRGSIGGASGQHRRSPSRSAQGELQNESAQSSSHDDLADRHQSRPADHVVGSDPSGRNGTTRPCSHVGRGRSWRIGLGRTDPAATAAPAVATASTNGTISPTETARRRTPARAGLDIAQSSEATQPGNHPGAAAAREAESLGSSPRRKSPSESSVARVATADTSGPAPLAAMTLNPNAPASSVSASTGRRVGDCGREHVGGLGASAGAHRPQSLAGG